jgi:RNA polymerase sigma factor (sigma-70 family)
MEHRLPSLVRRAIGDTRSDAELLDLIRDDHGAFAELVARHGPLVWGVCRHLLGEADAEDAFQATFVALVRSTIRDRAALAAWLHGAAVRISLAARREAGRRRSRERAAAVREAVSSPQPADWEDTMALVHREVAALREADRSAFVLCVLEGLTQAETAARLRMACRSARLLGTAQPGFGMQRRVRNCSGWSLPARRNTTRSTNSSSRRTMRSS